ncbi:MAG: XdhC family protein [Rhodocyclaceae bacterium]|nr:XdhC family protein [Rhodocyclaceae bacterium]
MLSSDLFDLAARLQRDGTPCAMATVIQVDKPSSARVGNRALITACGHVHGWVGGGCVQPAVLETARQVLLDGQARHVRVVPEVAGDGPPGVVQFPMSCESGGSVDLFVEALPAHARLVVFGDSPVARALVGFAAGVGFCAEVIANGHPADFPQARRVLAEVEAETLPDECYVVVATQGRGDLAALKAALQLKPRYLGLVASRRKAAALLDQLREEGLADEELAPIEAPAGLDIGARSGEEIALSIAAGLVTRRRAAAHRQAPQANVREAPAPAAHRKQGCCGESPAPVPAAGHSCCGH